MLIVALVFTALSFICSAIAMHTHWFVSVTANSRTMNVGFLLADLADDTPVPVSPGGFCTKLKTTGSGLNTTSSTCTDYETLVFALYLVYAVGMLFLIVGIVACITHMRSGIIFLVLALTFQTTAVFGFFFRVLGLQMKVAADWLAGSVTSWGFGWPSFVGFGGIFTTFLAALIFAITYRPPDPPSVVPNAPAADGTQPPPADQQQQQQQQQAPAWTDPNSSSTASNQQPSAQPQQVYPPLQPQQSGVAQ
jgi:hypothetical protein